MFDLFKLLVYVILPPALALISLRRGRARGASTERHYFLDRLLFWYLVIAVGVAGTLSGVSQMFNGEMTARLTGWPYSPFVVELGFMNLAFGVLGLLCIRIKGTWWYAVGVGYGIFMGLAAYYHIYDYFAHSNTSAGNSPLGIVFWTDLILAIALLVLSALHAHTMGASRGAARTSRRPAVR